jgi:hypothetical protein
MHISDGYIKPAIRRMLPGKLICDTIPPCVAFKDE